jgi:hypothetical protein
MPTDFAFKGATLPDKLRIVDGELVCADGSDVREYLRQFAAAGNISPDTPVVLMRKDGHEQDRRDADILRHWAA